MLSRAHGPPHWERNGDSMSRLRLTRAGWLNAGLAAVLALAAVGA